MRIIAGIYRSRRINSDTKPKRNKFVVRPSSDRARETLFNILSNRIDFKNLRCLDLFSGTGSYGFECLSRGAFNCVFVDKYQRSIELVKKTSEQLGCEERVQGIRADVINFLRNSDTNNAYDLVFADPPYNYKDYGELAELIMGINFKIFVLEYSNAGNMNLSKLISEKMSLVDRKIGKTLYKIFIQVK
ncbi:MAG: RsmD family RNA methyltransferase [Ignavibacteria bacterium]